MSSFWRSFCEEEFQTTLSLPNIWFHSECREIKVRNQGQKKTRMVWKINKYDGQTQMSLIRVRVRVSIYTQIRENFRLPCILFVTKCKTRICTHDVNFFLEFLILWTASGLFMHMHSTIKNWVFFRHLRFIPSHWFLPQCFYLKYKKITEAKASSYEKAELSDCFPAFLMYHVDNDLSTVMIRKPCLRTFYLHSRIYTIRVDARHP